MKKVKLTQEEENLLKDVIETLRELTVLSKKKDKLFADFWYMLTTPLNKQEKGVFKLPF